MNHTLDCYGICSAGKTRTEDEVLTTRRVQHLYRYLLTHSLTHSLPCLRYLPYLSTNHLSTSCLPYIFYYSHTDMPAGTPVLLLPEYKGNRTITGMIGKLVTWSYC
ncbi:hypothetical protein N658DRAFT_82039 [Parathielavia hyrcaniae]|uniref:Uncharacterized protein n=1 Tax=Parathielavia hyrcaniae TaxID=113614 RepID=A0AAN6SWX3_9PEZI|nr:hypothetical protein N658DRAFT_82039 [Parathielavia hyrcaniae]